MKTPIQILFLVSLVASGVAPGRTAGGNPATQPKVFDRDLVENAEAIAVVRAVSTHSYWGRDSLIWTTSNFIIQEKLKGSLTSSFSLETKGGEVGDVGLISSNSPRFLQGKTYLLFLSKDVTGRLSVVDARGAIMLDGLRDSNRQALDHLKSLVGSGRKEKEDVDY